MIFSTVNVPNFTSKSNFACLHRQLKFNALISLRANDTF